MTIRCPHGDTVLYPIVQLELKVEGVSLWLEAAVSNHHQCLFCQVLMMHKCMSCLVNHLLIHQLNFVVVVARTQVMRQLQKDD